MSSDWEDGMDAGKRVNYTIPGVEIMAAIMIGIGESNTEYAFPATLQQMLRYAAGALISAGCCANRPDTDERDGRTFGIATELTSNIAAETARISIKMTGYSNDAVAGSSKLHRAIFNTIKD